MKVVSEWFGFMSNFLISKIHQDCLAELQGIKDWASGALWLFYTTDLMDTNHLRPAMLTEVQLGAFCPWSWEVYKEIINCYVLIFIRKYNLMIGAFGFLLSNNEVNELCDGNMYSECWPHCPAERLLLFFTYDILVLPFTESLLFFLL